MRLIIVGVSTGLENPGKSLNWKKIFQEVLESPGINFLN
jgi:hypothetical protein